MLSFLQGPPGRFINKWIALSPYIDGADNTAIEGTHELSLQAICSDGTSLAIVGDNSPYVRVVGTLENLDGRNMSYIVQVCGFD